MVRFRFKLLSHAGSGPKAHRRGVLAVVADADKGLKVFVLAMDDGQWRTISTRVYSGLAPNGDVVPCQGTMRMGFDDGLLSREPARDELGGNLDVWSRTRFVQFPPRLEMVGAWARSFQTTLCILSGRGGSTLRLEEPLYLGMGPLLRIKDLANESGASGRLQNTLNSDHMANICAKAKTQGELPEDSLGCHAPII